MPNNLFQGLLPDARHAYARRPNRFRLGGLDDDFDANHRWTAGFRLIQSERVCPTILQRLVG